MSLIPRFTHWQYQSGLMRLKREMGPKWVALQLEKLGIKGEPHTDEERWSVCHHIDREASWEKRAREKEEAK